MVKDVVSEDAGAHRVASERMRGSIVMIGTSVDTQGGIASVIRVYMRHGKVLHSALRHVSTHCDGSKLAKARTAGLAWIRYMRLLLGRQVRLLHVHCASGPSFWRKYLFLVPTFAMNLPIVLHWHGGGLVDFYRHSPRWQQRLIARVFTQSDRVIALSEQWQIALTAMFPQARVVTIPNPVLLAKLPASDAHSHPSLLFLGRIVREKGVEDLLRALPSVLERFPQCRLVMAGSGDLPRYRDLAAQLGVGHAVRFPGYVDGEQKANLLREASVFVLPSHIEAMPMSILEAMSCGVPVVATRVGGIPQAVRHGVDGVLFEPTDVAALAEAIVRVLSDDRLRRNLSVSARLRVEQNFAADLILPKVQELWSTVLQERTTRKAKAWPHC